MSTKSDKAFLVNYPIIYAYINNMYKHDLGKILIKSFNEWLLWIYSASHHPKAQYTFWLQSDKWVEFNVHQGVSVNFIKTSTKKLHLIWISKVWLPVLCNKLSIRANTDLADRWASVAKNETFHANKLLMLSWHFHDQTPQHFWVINIQRLKPYNPHVPRLLFVLSFHKRHQWTSG